MLWTEREYQAWQQHQLNQQPSQQPLLQPQPQPQAQPQPKKEAARTAGAGPRQLAFWGKQEGTEDAAKTA